MHNFYKAIIVGAGVSGLAAAIKLEEAGAKTLILESSDQIGGRMRTDSLDGFILDRGFQVFPSSYKNTAALLGNLKFSTYTSAAKIWDNSKFITIYNPLRHPLKLLQTIKAGIFSIADCIKVLAISCNKKLQDEELSSLEFLSNMKFSKNSIRLFFKPFLSGIFLDNTLKTSSLFLEFALQKFTFGKAQLPDGGIQAVPETLAKKLKNTEIRLNTKVIKVLEDGVMLQDGSIERAEVIIVATDATTTEKLFDLPTTGEWRSATTCYFSSNQAPFAEPILVLNASENALINSLSVLSNINRTYAPKNKSLISVSLRQADPNITSEKVEDIKQELSSIFGQEVSKWSHIKSYYIEKALPTWRQIPSLKWRHPRHTFIAGDWLQIPSIESAVVSGQLAAKEALSFIKDNLPPNSELAEVKHRLELSIAKKELPEQILPNYRSIKDDGSFFMTRDNSGFHLLSQERGEETFRLTAQSIDEFIEIVKQNLKQS